MLRSKLACGRQVGLWVVGSIVQVYGLAARGDRDAGSPSEIQSVSFGWLVNPGLVFQMQHDSSGTALGDESSRRSPP